ncbi:putative hexosyltransferase MUCI70 [Wolffia australiana]
MSGSALGLRSASCGSLASQYLAIDARFLGQQAPGNGRKNQRMSISAGKEKVPYWICRLCFPIRIGRFLAFLASVGALMILTAGVLVFRRGGDVSEISDTAHDALFSLASRPSITLLPPKNIFISQRDRISSNIHSPPNNYKTVEVNASQSLLPYVPSTPLPSKHPCEGFSFPPPPVDRKRTGPRPCPVCYVPVEQAIAFMPSTPSVSPVLKNLTFFYEEDLPINGSRGGSSFGGHPSLEQRNETFHVKESMTVHCGFAKGKSPGKDSGFDIDGSDLLEMEQCHNVVVASAIFGNYDVMQQPKNIHKISLETVCFYMFVDEETETFLKNSTTWSSSNKIGLWRIVVVRNIPYIDPRRTGKIPKLLLHRIFPNARYSLWIDGKLQLVVDPYQILERFLWRKKATFAISRHYKRFDVFEEAEANKAAGKYDNASIDSQIQFYTNEGLTHYSLAKLPITSDVPEGCVIIREHIPITNLFTCLWFNEVDRFTSRDQLSFAMVRDRLTAAVDWGVNMFLDCERRNFVVQTYHRDLLESMAPPPPRPPPLPPIPPPLEKFIRSMPVRPPPKAPKPLKSQRRPGSRRHRMRSAEVRNSE